MPKRIVVGGLLGLVLAIVGEILTVVTAGAIAFTQFTKIEIPGIIVIWAEQPGRARELVFNPDFVGMGVTGVVIIGLCILVTVYMVPRRTVPPAS